MDAGSYLHSYTSSYDQITICMQRLQAFILREQEICARFRARLRLRRSKRPLRIGGCRRSRRLRSWRFSTLMTSFTVISNLRSQILLSTDDDLVNNGEQVVLEPGEIHSVEDNDEVSSDDEDTSGHSEAFDESDLDEASNDVSRHPWKPPWNKYAARWCPSHNAQKLFEQLSFITANQNSKAPHSLLFQTPPPPKPPDSPFHYTHFFDYARESNHLILCTNCLMKFSNHKFRAKLQQHIHPQYTISISVHNMATTNAPNTRIPHHPWSPRRLERRNKLDLRHWYNRKWHPPCDVLFYRSIDSRDIEDNRNAFDPRLMELNIAQKVFANIPQWQKSVESLQLEECHLITPYGLCVSLVNCDDNYGFLV